MELKVFHRYNPINIMASLACLLLLSCDQGGQDRPNRVGLEDGNRSQASSGQQGGLAGDPGSSTNEKEKVEKIDANKLTVFNVRAVKKREQLFLTHNLSYEPDGRADYINYLICPLEDVGKQCPEALECTAGGHCFEGVSAYNRVRLPLLYAGKVLFKVKACIDREKALTNETCGPWEEKEFDSQAFDIRIASLMGRAVNLKQGLGKLNMDYREALDTFVEEARACDALNAEVQKVLDSKVKVVEEFVRLPIEWFGKAGETLADTVLSGQSDQVFGLFEKAGQGVSRQLERACLEFGEATHDGVCKFLIGAVTVGKSFISAMSPVTAIGTISNKVHDVYYGTFLGQGDKLVPKGCFAEQNLQSRVGDIERQMQAKLQELQVIKQQLQQAGESTVIPDAEE